MWCNIVSTPPICSAIDVRFSKPVLTGSSTVQGYIYGKIGYTQSECKKSAGWPEKKLLIEEDELSNEDRQPAYNEGSEEKNDSLLFGDRGEALVIHKSVFALKKEKED